MTVHHADWLDLARTLDAESVDLLYADPPFNTGKTQQGRLRDAGCHDSPSSAQTCSDEGREALLRRRRRAVAPDGSTIAPLSPSHGERAGVRGSPPSQPHGPADDQTHQASAPSYPDTFPSTAAWLAWLRERLEATLPALKPAGAILLHVDWRTSHHARLLLDELVGPDRFINHLVWSYGLGGSSPRRFARKHDDILYYALDPDRSYFEPPMVPATSNRMKGELKKATDVLDIPAINNMAAERTGYPTQKPLALLRLLITACCPPQGLVLDPCCGSGTTLVAAIATGRSAVGTDTNPDAVRIARQRLAAVSSSSSP